MASQESHLRKFDLDIEDAAKAVDMHISDFMRWLVLRILTGFIQRSPVDTGRFRASWRVGNGAPSDDVHAPVAKGTNISTDPSQAVAAAASTFDGRKTANSIFITNSLPYAIRLEEGWSGQAPNGMVAITVAEIEAEFQAAQ